MGAGMGVFLGAFQQMTTPLDVDLQPANVPMKTTFMNEVLIFFLSSMFLGKEHIQSLVFERQKHGQTVLPV